MLSADLESIYNLSDLNEVVDELAVGIIDWNTRMKYSSTGVNSDVEGNCQQFIESLCSRIGVQLPTNGPLSSWLNTLRKYGKCELQYKPSDDFKKKYDIQKSKVSFPSHCDLDRFVQQLIAKNPLFPDVDKDVYMFLKSLDRAFWLRHYKFQESIQRFESQIERFESAHQSDSQSMIVTPTRKVIAIREQIKELVEQDKDVRPLEATQDDEEHDCLCPFKDPMDTHSILFV